MVSLTVLQGSSTRICERSREMSRFDAEGIPSPVATGSARLCLPVLKKAWLSSSAAPRPRNEVMSKSDCFGHCSVRCRPGGWLPEQPLHWSIYGSQQFTRPGVSALGDASRSVELLPRRRVRTPRSLYPLKVGPDRTEGVPPARGRVDVLRLDAPPRHPLHG